MGNNILEDLNTDQKKAVEATNGPVLILAGAGSGKTRVLTTKVAYLILEKKVNPCHILMVTFTNKAADEMKGRIRKILGKQGKIDLPYAGTFHSFCARLLRKEGKHLGIPVNFVIYDSKDSKDLIKEIIKRLGISEKQFSCGAVLATIEGAKNELMGPLEYGSFAAGYWQKTVAKIYIEYQKTLQNNEALDFSDLIFEVVRLFTKNAEVKRYYQNKYEYILVDEYQDTNKAQYELTLALAGRWRNVCVVGDCSQSIYGFRGADYRNVLTFKKSFSDVAVFNLERNYRSTQKILDSARSVISKNSGHPVLSLWTEKNKGEKIVVYQARNEKEEARFVIERIQELIVNNNYSYSDFAVLYRTNAQSRVIEEAFLKTGVPYVLVGGTRFYERKEVKDVLSYLRLIYNPKDLVSYKRAEKIGKRRLAKFLDWYEKRGGKISDDVTSKILEDVLRVTGYLSLYNNKKSEEDLARVENVNELASVAAEFSDLADFLENVALVEREYLPTKPLSNGGHEAVTLMTMHGAKGLEYVIVFLVGMEEGLFPHSRSMMRKEELEEERRLCYVGITRAKERLFLTFAVRRLYFGTYGNNPVSRFVEDIPEKLIEWKGREIQIEPEKNKKVRYDKWDDEFELDYDWE